MGRKNNWVMEIGVFFPFKVTFNAFAQVCRERCKTNFDLQDQKIPHGFIFLYITRKKTLKLLHFKSVVVYFVIKGPDLQPNAFLIRMCVYYVGQQISTISYLNILKLFVWGYKQDWIEQGFSILNSCS